jgi:hypothetical protein
MKTVLGVSKVSLHLGACDHFAWYHDSHANFRKFHFFIFKNLRFLNIKKWFLNF